MTSTSFLLNFKGSYILVPVIVLFSVILIFIDSKITGKNHDKKVYLKTGLLSGLIAILCIYINTLLGTGLNHEEILTGEPPF